MPPGSLSTLAVMNPGPRTEKSTRICIFQRRSHFMIAVCGHVGLRNSNGQNNRDEEIRLLGKCFPQKISVIPTAAEGPALGVDLLQESTCFKNGLALSLSFRPT